jgi:YD repeat-containing protein
MAASASAPGTITTFDVPGAVVLRISGIDAAGLIVGTYSDRSGVEHGFTRDAAGTITTIDAPGAGTGFDQGTSIAGVSSGGQICGTYVDSNSKDHGFWMDTSGTIITFEAPDSNFTIANSVNDSGQVAGIYYSEGFPDGPFGFIWSNSAPAVTFAPPNTEFLDSAEINSSGEVAGYFETIVKDHDYYRDANGNFVIFSASAEGAGFVTAINDSSTIVGYVGDQTGWQGFIREGGSITPVSISGSPETFIYSVNDGGTVAGTYTDASGVYHGFFQDRFGNVTTISEPYAGTAAEQGTMASSINASGEVAGAFIGPLGTYHGFLWR